MAERGKKYQAAVKLVEADRSYTPQEAVALAKKASFTKFDETVELHLRLGVDPRHSDQQVRGVATLPHGLGKKVRVLVFAQGEARRAGRGGGPHPGGGGGAHQEDRGGLPGL